MPIVVTCPGCQTSYNLPEQFRGKKVRCRKCHFEFAPAANAPIEEARLNVEAVDESDMAEGEIQSKAQPVRARRVDDEDEGRRSRRRWGDEDDAPAPPKKSNAMLYVLMGGGAFLLLLCAGCGGVGYYFFVYLPRKGAEYVQEKAEHFEEMAKEGQERGLEQQREMQREAMDRAGGPDNPQPNNPFNPGRGERQPRKGEYANLDEAVADLKPGDVLRCRKAIDWVARAKVDPERQAEVAQKLEALLDDHQLRDPAAKALALWATKESVPALIRALDSDSIGVRQAAIETLGKLKDERAAAPLAKRLKEFFDRANASKALVTLGPVAEKEVVKYAFDGDRGVQNEARKILTNYNTKNTVYITQAVEELKSGDNARRQQAAEWLEKASVEETQHGSVAKALEPLLLDNDGNTRDRALRALHTWATKETVPGLLKQLDHADGNVRKQVMEILANLKDERAIVPIGLRLTNFFDRQIASNALISMGPMVEPEVLKGLVNKDDGVRREVCRILGAVGTTKSVGTLQKLVLVEKNKDVALAAANAIRAIEERKGK